MRLLFAGKFIEEKYLIEKQNLSTFCFSISFIRCLLCKLPNCQW